MILRKGKEIFVKSLIDYFPFKEKIIISQNENYHLWDPKRSKLAAALMKGFPLEKYLHKKMKILYLGLAHGYTASFLSDLVPEGIIFGLDHSPTVLAEAVLLSEKRKNIVPILADANHPETYYQRISPVDLVYQDISQKNQLEIFFKNIDFFLKKKGYGFLMVKARSMDVAKKPKEIFRKVEQGLREKFPLLYSSSLEPYQRDHYFYLIRNL